MIELAQIIIPSLAVIISIIALINSRKDVQKQIRVNKLEEILEIISVLESYYATLHRLTSDYAKLELAIHPTQKLIDYNALIERIEHFISNIDKDKLQMQFARLDVLSNAYLPNNKVRLKIMALSHLYDAIFLLLYKKDIRFLNSAFKEGIPAPKNLTHFILSIQAEVIKEMNLGFDRIPVEQMNEYFEKEFKKDCGII